MSVYKFFTRYYWLIKTIKFKRKHKMGFLKKYTLDYLKFHQRWSIKLLYLKNENFFPLSCLMTSLILLAILSFFTIPTVLIINIFNHINFLTPLLIISIGFLPIMYLLLEFTLFSLSNILKYFINIYHKDTKR
jgi:hypothetical protein